MTGSRATSPPAGEHYFSSEPSSDATTHQLRLVVDGRAVELMSAGGVFSAERIDPGTSVLIAHAPPPPAAGLVADVGCGYGPIACALAIRAPGASVLAVDVNERARDLTRLNAERLALTNVTVAAPEEVGRHSRIDAIYSNPPIRVGKAALHELLSMWLARLTPDGRAYLVVHRNLGSDSLAAWLRDQGHPVERLVSVRGYRILSVGRNLSVGRQEAAQP